MLDRISSRSVQRFFFLLFIGEKTSAQQGRVKTAAIVIETYQPLGVTIEYICVVVITVSL